MARRRIGQGELGFDDRTTRAGSLDEIAGLINGADIDRYFAPIYASARGE